MIRVARRDELKAVAELARKTYADAFGHSFEPSDLAAHIESQLSDACFERYLTEDTFLLAEEGARLIGFLQIGKARADPVFGQLSTGDVELRRVYVLADFQNRGVGQRLINQALANAQGARRIFVDVWEENLGARRLYERYGFVIIGKREFR